MSDVLDWSDTAGGNDSTPPDGSPEGMAPSTVNDAVREAMAAVRRWQQDTSGEFHTTTGTGDAYEVTLSQSITSYAVGQRFAFKVNRANSGPATLNINGVGAKALTKMEGGVNQPLGQGDLQANMVVDVVYKSADRFEMVSSTSRAGGLESGTRAFFQQTAAPLGWTKVTEGINNRGLRVTTGAVGSGGSRSFESIFTNPRSTSNAGNHNHGGTNNTTLSVSQIPSHRHDSSSTVDSGGDPDNHRMGTGNADATSGTHIRTTGGGGAHSHGISFDGGHGHNFDMDLLYIDTIVAVKD